MNAMPLKARCSPLMLAGVSPLHAAPCGPPQCPPQCPPIKVMQLPESKLWPGAAAEMLQVVRYRPGEGYNSHTDYGGNLPHDRFLTVLLYLSDAPQQGGRTEFSRTERCQPSLGQVPRLHAPKGSALAFYSVLPDGNFDTHSKHSAGPVESRNDEKWVCNLWVWDPGRKSNSMDFL